MHFFADQLAFALHLHGKEVPQTAAAILATFDRLQRQIRGLRGLRLAVRSMHPISPAFRYTEPFPLQSQKNDRQRVAHYEPLEVIVQFESSGSWPDDREAIRALKAAFYAHMAELIAKELRLECQPTVEFLDLLCEGYAFRFYIHHERELQLLQREQPAEERKLEKRNVLRPLHNSTVHGLQSKFPMFGITARLAKIWMHSRTPSAARFNPIRLIV